MFQETHSAPANTRWLTYRSMQQVGENADSLNENLSAGKRS